ncbi:MAG: ArsA family ATPase [Ilumatobacter sp.]|nr:ArsA family ATPase [Ilumatobacter sp.]
MPSAGDPGASILDRRLVFVTGKGGVGKTSVAAALAHLAASSGKRTLVCEMDAKGSLADAFDTGRLKFAPREVEPNLFAMTMNTEDALREYLRIFVRVPFLGKIGPLARTFDFVADAAPGVKEILTVGKFCYEAKERNYDLIVVDAEATGHIVAQIGAPLVIRELVQVGLVRDQTDWMLEVLHDPAVTGVAIVTTPEEMPVNETLGLLDRLPAETGVAATTLIINRVLPALFDRSQAEIVDRLPEASSLLVEAAGKQVAAVLEAASITEARRRIGSEHLGRLREHTDLPMLMVPELFTRATGRRVVSLVADALAEELD